MTHFTSLKQSKQARFLGASSTDFFPPGRFALHCPGAWLKGERTWSSERLTFESHARAAKRQSVLDLALALCVPTWACCQTSSCCTRLRRRTSHLESGHVKETIWWLILLRTGTLDNAIRELAHDRLWVIKYRKLAHDRSSLWFALWATIHEVFKAFSFFRTWASEYVS